MIKRLLFVLLMCCINNIIFAQDYKITFLNTNSIRIGNKNLSTGSTFKKTDVIQWQDDMQAMKVFDLKNKKTIAIVAKPFKTESCSSLDEYLSKTNHLSTRGVINPNNLKKEDFKTDPNVLYLIDNVYVDASIYYDPSMTETIEFYDGKTKLKKSASMSSDNKKIIISRDMFPSSMSTNKSFKIDIIEYDSKMNWRYCIYRNLTVVLVPKKL